MSMSTMDTATVTPEVDQLVSATGDMEIARDTAGKMTKEAEDRVRKETLLLDLNDDCLLKILSFLPKDDLISIRLTNSRFKPLFDYSIKDLLDIITVDPALLAKFPLETSLDYYTVIAELAACVQFDKVTEDVVKAILPLATQLQMLMLRTEPETLKDMDAIKTFPISKTLQLIVGHTEKRYIDALLQRFGPSLVGFDFSSTPRADPSMAPNAKRIGVDGVWLGKIMSYWENCSLEVLGVVNQKDTETFHDFQTVKRNWAQIAKKEELQKLDCTGISSANLRISIIPQFNNLTTVDLVFHEPRLMCAMLRKIGPQLLTLGCTLDLQEVVEKGPVHDMLPVLGLIADGFPELKALTLYLPFPFTLLDVQPFRRLKKMTRAGFFMEPREATFLFVVQNENLKRFENDLEPDTDEIEAPEGFAEYLKEEKRSVVVFGKKYP